MVDIKLLLRFFEGDFVVKLLLLMLLYSVLPLGEIFIFLRLGVVLGNYLTLALAASTGLFGVLVAVREFRVNIDRIKYKVKEGEYPGREFAHLIAVLIGAIFLLTPGFITDFMGFLLFVPGIRTMIGNFVARRMKTKLNEIYEYLKMYDL